MKHKSILLSAIVIALSVSVLPVCAQSWVKKAAKSVFTLKTFDSEGTLLASSNGVFIGQQGEAVSCFEPFRGASRALVIDATGTELPVEQLLGASATYDVAKFRVGVKKSQPLAIATTKAGQGSSVYLLPYLETKKAVEGRVSKAETFADYYDYYTVRLTMPENGEGLPLLSDDGQLLGLMQRPATSTDTVCYAVSALFADSLKMLGLSINDPAIRSVQIRKALPDAVGQALLTLYVAGQTYDSLAYSQLIDDFIYKFPREPEGYVTRAQVAAADGRYADADADMSRAVGIGEKKDETHYSYSRMIYQKVLYRPEPAYEPWTLDRALDEAKAAYAEAQQPLYLQQQAYVLYAQQKYAEACAIYDVVSQSTLRSPDIFFEAARCHLMQKDTIGYLAQLDSCLSLFSRPYLKEAAPYILSRAQARIDARKYRDAVSDLNDYEQLMSTQVNASFYYLRFQAEVGGRLFQQALNDIDKAIRMAPDEEVYLAEKASLQVRVGLYDEAVETAAECIKLSPEYSDGHLFLGLARCLKGQKEEGVKSLQRALELGDEQARDLIEKYGK